MVIGVENFMTMRVRGSISSIQNRLA